MALPNDAYLLEIATWDGAEIIKETRYYSIYTYRPRNLRGLDKIQAFIRLINENTDENYLNYAELDCELLFHVQEGQIFGSIIHSEVASTLSMTRITHAFVTEECHKAHVKWTLRHSLSERYKSIVEGRVVTYAETTVTINEI